MMRVTTLRARADGPGQMIAYYAGLAEDKVRTDGISRGPVDYYLDPNEPPGRWWGDGCAALGVKGDVAADELRLLLEARHPGTGRPLGRGFGQTSARGFDATFSAPKSASVLWGLTTDPFVRAEVLAAHDAAVVAALQWFQTHGSVTRRGRKGVHQVDTLGVAVPLFRQHTSRTADPQLHTHALVMAKVQDPSGRWLSLDARFLKRQQRSISFIYAAALRAELTARLGVSWRPVIDGHAEIHGIPEGLLELFSARSAQVQAELQRRIAKWVKTHDGAEPSARTIAGLERRAVLASRPGKGVGIDGAALRAEWQGQARAAGFEVPSRPPTKQSVADMVPWHDQTIVAEAIERVAARSSTWLQADLAREIAALVPAKTARSAQSFVAKVDALAERARAQMIELHPPAPARSRRRVDGRPISEHVTDRCFTTDAILDQEARLLSWAAASVGPRVASTVRTDAEARVAAVRAITTFGRLTLVVGPAGAGKTTTLSHAVHQLDHFGHRFIGLAPSGKAADVLAAETGARTTTVAKLLHEYAKPTGPAPEWDVPIGATVILDEAGMVATTDLERLVGLAQANCWHLVCVGDPAQLPAVGRGGMFAEWCERFGAHQLQVVQRFAEPWQAQASLALRQGEERAAALYAKHGRLQVTHPALVALRVADGFEQLAKRDESVAVTTASVGMARSINTEIQGRRGHGDDEPCVGLADGTSVFVGDRIATRRNVATLVTSRKTAVRNRQTWTVRAVRADGSLDVADPERGSVRLPAGYVARHVELGWAVTGYGSQGVTVDHGICVVEPSSTRAGIYVGMTRGRDRNLALVVDPTGLDNPEEAFAAAIGRPPNALTAHAVRRELYEAHGVALAEDPALRVSHQVPERDLPARRPPSPSLSL